MFPFSPPDTTTTGRSSKQTTQHPSHACHQEKGPTNSPLNRTKLHAAARHAQRGPSAHWQEILKLVCAGSQVPTSQITIYTLRRNIAIDALVRTKQQTCAITRRLIHPPATLISTASQDSGTVTRYPPPPMTQILKPFPSFYPAYVDARLKIQTRIPPQTRRSTTQPAPRRALHPIDRNMPQTHLNTSQRISCRCPKARKPSPPTPSEDARSENAPGHRAPGQKNPLHPKGKKGGGVSAPQPPISQCHSSLDGRLSSHSSSKHVCDETGRGLTQTQHAARPGRRRTSSWQPYHGHQVATWYHYNSAYTAPVLFWSQLHRWNPPLDPRWTRRSLLCCKPRAMAA